MISLKYWLRGEKMVRVSAFVSSHQAMATKIGRPFKQSKVAMSRCHVCLHDVDSSCVYVQVVGGLGEFLLEGSGCTPGVVAGCLSDLLLHLCQVHHLCRPIMHIYTGWVITHLNDSYKRIQSAQIYSCSLKGSVDTYTLSMALRISHME